jgi:hypothetical protein
MNTRRHTAPGLSSPIALASICLAACVAVEVLGAPPAAASDIAFAGTPVVCEPDTALSAAFAPDGEALYVHLGVQAVNLWPSLVALWPEALGGVVVLATLALAWVVFRRHRNRQIKGMPHCRRCNYELTPQVRPRDESDSTGSLFPFTWSPGVMCPECGTGLDQARPVLGRGLARRVAPTFAVWLCIVLGYGSMFALGVPRRGWVSEWLDLSSTWLVSHADSWAIRWLSPRVDSCDRVIEVDPATGAQRRIVATRWGYSVFELTLTPDGSTLFLSGGRDSLLAIDVQSGRALNRVRLPGQAGVEHRRPAVIGFSPDGTDAYVQWWNIAENKSGVSRWIWRTGTSAATLVEEAGYVDGQAGRASNWPRGFVLRDHRGTTDSSPSPRFVSVPNFMESFPTKSFVMRVHEGGSLARDMSVLPLPDHLSDPAVTLDGSTAILPSEYGSHVSGFDLDTGSMIGSIAAPDPATAGQCVLSRGNRYLVTDGIKGTCVRDTELKKWILSLHPPSGLYAPSSTVSADGRWVAAVCQGHTTTPTGQRGYVHRVVVWDLGDRRLVEGPEPGPADAASTNPAK